MSDDDIQLEFGAGEYDAFLRATQVTRTRTIETASRGELTANPGDWIVVTGDGLVVLEDWQFQQRYPEYDPDP